MTKSVSMCFMILIIHSEITSLSFLINDVVNASSLKLFLKIDWISIGFIKMLCTIGMLIYREPEVEVILLVKLHAIHFILVCYLRYGRRSLWLAPIKSAMHPLCYAIKTRRWAY